MDRIVFVTLHDTDMTYNEARDAVRMAMATGMRWRPGVAWSMTDAVSFKPSELQPKRSSSGEMRMPPGVFAVADGNRPEDRSAACRGIVNEMLAEDVAATLREQVRNNEDMAATLQDTRAELDKAKLECVRLRDLLHSLSIQITTVIA